MYRRLLQYSASLFLVGSLLTGSAKAQDTDSVVSEEERRLLEEALTGDLASKEPVVTASPSAAIGPSSMNPSISMILDVAGAWFSDSEPMQVGAHDPSQTGLNFQQLELHAESRVDPYFDFQTNIVFSQFGVEIEEAYARTLSLPASLQLKAGLALLSFGRANPTHPHAWHFLDQPLILGKFMGGEGGRGLGVEASWLVPLEWFTKLTVSVSQSAGECCSRSFVGSTNEPINGIEDFIYLARLEQFWELTPNWSILVGASGLFGENKTGLNNHSLIMGGDLMIRYRPLNSPLRRAFHLQVEWMDRHRQVPDSVLHDAGLYVEARVTWSPEWETGLRWEWVDGVDSDPTDADWISDRMRNTAQVTWYPSHFSRLRLQVANDNPSWRDESIWSAMLGLEVLVGAHSAHNY